MAKFVDGIEYFDREDFHLFAPSGSPVAVNHVRNQETLGAKHVHDFYEMATIVDGFGEYSYRDAVYPINPGDTFIIQPGIQHQYLNQHNLSVINFLWYPEELPIPPNVLMSVPGFRSFFDLEPQTRDIFRFEQRLILTPEQSYSTQSFFRRLENELHRKANGFELNVGFIFAELLIEICRFYTMPGASHISDNNDLQRMEKVLAFLEQNFKKQLARSKVAKIYGSSEATFCRNFKRIMGETFSEYLLNLRLRHVQKLLIESDASISEIAFACGFCDSNYLCYRYRKKFGIPPLQFRLQSQR